MSSVEIQLNGRLGNCMFQYAVGRLMADEMNICLHVRSDEHNVNLPAMFPNVHYDIERGTCNNPAPTLKIEQLNQPDGWPDIGPVDIFGMRKVAHGRTISINGFFESYVHLEPFSERLRHIYHREKRTHNRIAVHQRLGDVAWAEGNGWDYIRAAVNKTISLRSVEQLPVIIVSEEPNHYLTRDMHTELQRATGCAVEVMGPPSIHDAFDEVCGSRHQILTNSTWTWWAGFLGAPHSHAHVMLSERQPVPWRNAYLFDARLPENFEVQRLHDPPELYALRDARMRRNIAARVTRAAEGLPF